MCLQFDTLPNARTIEVKEQCRFTMLLSAMPLVIFASADKSGVCCAMEHTWQRRCTAFVSRRDLRCRVHENACGAQCAASVLAHPPRRPRMLALRPAAGPRPSVCARTGCCGISSVAHAVGLQRPRTRSPSRAPGLQRPPTYSNCRARPRGRVAVRARGRLAVRAHAVRLQCARCEIEK